MGLYEWVNNIEKESTKIPVIYSDGLELHPVWVIARLFMNPKASNNFFSLESFVDYTELECKKKYLLLDKETGQKKYVVYSGIRECPEGYLNLDTLKIIFLYFQEEEGSLYFRPLLHPIILQTLLSMNMGPGADFLEKLKEARVAADKMDDDLLAITFVDNDLNFTEITNLLNDAKETLRLFHKYSTLPEYNKAHELFIQTAAKSEKLVKKNSGTARQASMNNLEKLYTDIKAIFQI